jgi:hypothetical protein
MIGYKPLDEAGEKISGDYETLMAMAATAAGIKVAHAAMTAVEPMSSPTHVDAERKQIVVTLAIRVEGSTTHSERYARTQCLVTGPDDLPMVHASAG